MKNIYRGPFSSFHREVSEEKIKMRKVNERRMPSDGKSSHCLWQGELKKEIMNKYICLEGIFSKNTLFETIKFPQLIGEANTPPKSVLITTNIIQNNS